MSRKVKFKGPWSCPKCFSVNIEKKCDSKYDNYMSYFTCRKCCCDFTFNSLKKFPDNFKLLNSNMPLSHSSIWGTIPRKD